jgi:hypothetical protein
MERVGKWSEVGRARGWEKKGREGKRSEGVSVGSQIVKPANTLGLIITGFNIRPLFVFQLTIPPIGHSANATMAAFSQ